jgi:hypothetical protein
MASAIQRTVQTLDPSLPVYEVRTMDAWLDTTVSPRRFNVMLQLAFGALGLTLGGDWNLRRDPIAALRYE